MDPEMAEVLLAMEMLAGGSITNYSPTGTGGVADSKPPAGVRFDGRSELPLHAYWRARYEQAVGNYQREQVYKAAQAELDAFRKRPKITISMETEEELEARIVREGQGWTVEQVAIHCRCTTTFARKARLKAGVSITTGNAPSEIAIDSLDQREHAREMAENGATERQIEFVTKLPKTTVRRILGRAA